MAGGESRIGFTGEPTFRAPTRPLIECARVNGKDNRTRERPDIIKNLLS